MSAVCTVTSLSAKRILSICSFTDYAVEATRVPSRGILLARVGSMPNFSLLTFNCFGVPALTTRRRLLTLARELNQRADMVVCLQEVQAHIYRRLLMQETTHTACAYEQHLHAPKGGLLT